MSAKARVAQAGLWAAVLTATTLALLPFRGRLDKAHVAMVLLLVVLNAGARGGRALGLLVGFASFIVFDVLFVPPYGRVTVANPFDWLVLGTFLITSSVASQLMHRAREATRVATEQRERLENERRRAEALLELDALKNSVLTSVSHDLRTPLTSIKALANQLGVLGDERSQIIEEQADRLGRYVSDLLDWSRLNAGSMPVRLEVNAIDDLLSATVEECEPQLDGRSLEVIMPSDGILLAGRFDLSLSLRIVTNLVENARKYSPNGSVITIEASRTADVLVIVVMDRGAGVPAEDVERIFQPFHRASNVTDDRGSAGLGLALCRRMAELQQGTLTYAPRDGGGSVFALRLPAVRLPDPDASL